MRFLHALLLVLTMNAVALLPGPAHAFADVQAHHHPAAATHVDADHHHAPAPSHASRDCCLTACCAPAVAAPLLPFAAVQVVWDVSPHPRPAGDPRREDATLPAPLRPPTSA